MVRGRGTCLYGGKHTSESITLSRKKQLRKTSFGEVFHQRNNVLYANSYRSDNTLEESDNDSSYTRSPPLSPISPVSPLGLGPGNNSNILIDRSVTKLMGSPLAPVTFYCIVIYSFPPLEIYRRYSEFYSLNRKLNALNLISEKDVSFPRKTLFNFKESVIHQRLEKFDNYVRYLYENLMHHSVVSEFLNL
jgi:hypothetical protein